MRDPTLSRRTLLRGTALGLGTAALGLRSARAALPSPSSPVTVSVVDVAGNLALTQGAIENFRKAKPQRVSKFNFTKAPAPELPGKIKAQQGAGRSDIDLVLTGTDFLAAGIDQGLLIKVLPEYASKFPGLAGNYLPAAAKMQELAADYGIAV